MHKKTKVDLTIRTPQESEVDSILALFEYEVRAGKMLPRSGDNIRRQLDTWLVATDGDRVVGCVSLVFFDAGLCEVRSLAVDRGCRGRGLGSELVLAAVDLARSHGVRRVLALTRAATLFEQIGFQRDAVQNYPEKVWRDCAPCPFRNCCDEVALIYHLVESADGGPEKE
ncbi:MAG: GNAT family N-acetyltransferase [Anaerolineae bacterium]|nr:GNAT family N-acetyltransferase [Anaerolineae bacterium]